ncbi:MMPL family transporter [Nocardia jejuensis]|uniref:MMPL family transporter n=1 Tax=Nocardia jejuensis TaxID=328049 RepID=UPI000832D67C|nr:MMPL family transporter [Nocardia jejuensis]
MFTRWGDLVYKLRFTVFGVVVAGMLGLGVFGLGLEDHLSSSGWFDPTSQSTKAAELKDSVYGRDHNSDVVLLYTAPDGKTIDDPEFSAKVVDSLNNLPKLYPEITGVNGAYWKTDKGQWIPNVAGSKDKKFGFATVAIKGDNDTDMLRNYGKVQDSFGIPGIKVEVAGLQPIAFTLNDTIASDVKRMELLAIPAVALLLFFIFGGIVAAALPLIIGGLTILASNGIIMGLTKFTEVNSFVSAVVSMIGLGLAIDYGLFIVSRFREELAEGYDTRAAVRRSVMTAGRTVTSSATMIIAASAGMLLFPQGFLKSVAYGTIAAVLLAMISALTVLPAMLAVLGPRVDALGLKWIRRTKTADEVENGFWGKMTAWVMKHPLKVAIPLTIGLLLLIIPVKNLQFGGISETYLPPDNVTRVAQEHFDELFPLRKSDPVQLVIVTDNSKDIGAILKQANQAPGLVKNAQFGIPAKPPNGSNVWVTDATVQDTADDTVAYLRSMDVPDGTEVMVTGQPVMMMDSVNSLLDRMPLMIGLVLLVTTILMFLTFGSLVLPLKAALMSALGLGSTLGILTWIFIDGHGASLLNFTPQPIMSPVLVLIIAIIYGLSIDYEVFLLSRMVEARTQGASTTEAVRAGTAQTGRIITAAALILLVVTGAFAFSDLVMMQYIAYGMVAALFIDATVLRMLLVPATMKLLGDDCWWAPAWMKRIQQKVGLGEPILDDERPGGGEVVDLVKTTPITDPVTMQIPIMADGSMPARPSRKPRPARNISIDSEAPTQRLDNVAGTDSAKGATGTASAPRPPAESVQRSTAGEDLARPGTGVTPSTSTGPAFTKSGTGSGNTPESDSTPVPAPAPAPRKPTDFISLLGDPPNPPITQSGSGFEAPAAPPVTAKAPLSWRAPAKPAAAPNTPTPFDDPDAEDTVAQPVTPADRGSDAVPPPNPVADSTARDGAFTPPSAGDRSSTLPSVSQPVSPAPQADSTPPPAGAERVSPPIGAERVLPPPGAKVAPHPATRAQLYQPHPSESSPPEPVAEEPHPTHHSVEDQPPTGEGRGSIEQWMSDLRSARRRADKEEEDDEGKHRGGAETPSRTVSVNELLRRQNRD